MRSSSPGRGRPHIRASSLASIRVEPWREAERELAVERHRSSALAAWLAEADETIALVERQLAECRRRAMADGR